MNIYQYGCRREPNWLRCTNTSLLLIALQGGFKVAFRKVIALMMAALVAGLVLGSMGVAGAGTREVKTLGSAGAKAACADCANAATCDPAAMANGACDPAAMANGECGTKACDPAAAAGAAGECGTGACGNGQTGTCP